MQTRRAPLGRNLLMRGFSGVLFFSLTAAVAQGQFGPVAVGTSSTQTISVTAQTAGTVSAVEVLTAGASGLDYAAATGGSCAGAGLPSGGVCWQPVTFTPAYPGVRAGAVVLLNSSNQVIGSAFVSGTGTGGLALMLPSAAQSSADLGAAPGAQLPGAGVVETLAGDGKWQDTNLGDGGPATAAELFLPAAVVIDGFGNLYIADSNHNRVRMVCAGTQAAIAGTSCPSQGIINTIVGGSGTVLNNPSGLAMDGAGNLYIADSGAHTVLELSAATGMVTTFAGTGTSGYKGDGGAATAAELETPFSMAVDALGDVFITDNEANVIRAVCAAPGTLFGVSCAAAGDIVTVAGTGTAGAAGDGGPAIAAQINGPYSVAIDPSGNLFIADTENNKVRAVCATAGGTVFGTTCSAVGTIFTVSGDGQGNFAGDGGAATSAEINSPSGLAFDPAGNLYIADTQNNRIRKINATTDVIVTLGGDGSANFAGDGDSALDAAMHGPYGLAFYYPQPGAGSPLAHLGDLLIADFFNQRIRAVQSSLAMVTFAGSVKQGLTSPEPTANTDPTLVTVENDGNAPLDVTDLTADANFGIGTQAIAGATLCAGGNALAIGSQCTVEPIFAPSDATTLSAATVEGGNIDVDNDVAAGIVAANSPLVIEMNGTASPVNVTSLSLTGTPNPSNVGQSVTFTATLTITSGSGTPTGTVTFFDGGTQLGSPANVSGSEASLSISTLTVGLHSITATYNGDANDSKSTSNTFVQTVNEGTATAISSSANPSALGNAVTFTATVTTPNGGGIPLDGQVTFSDNGVALGPAVSMCSCGTTKFTISTLADGVHSITATYSGDASKLISGSTSAALKQEVLAASTVTLSPPTPNPSTYGTAVTLTATVSSSASEAPTGSVTFLDGANKIGTAPLNGTTGEATLSITTLAVGTHTLSASYAGDSNVGPGSSGPQSLTVNPTQTDTSISASPNPGIAGKPVSLSAKVAIVQGSAKVTGQVTFNANGAPVCGAAVGTNGFAECNAALAPGKYSLVASYGGDANDTASASQALSFTVVQATTNVALTSSGSPAQVLSAVVFKAVVSGNGGTPTGPVTFTVDGSGASTQALDASGTASFSDSSLAVGSHQVVVSYAGDTDDAGSASSTFTEVIHPIPTVTDLGLSSTGGPTPQGILVATTLAGTGPTPTGTVTFMNGSKVIGSTALDSSGVATLTPSLVPGNYSIVAEYGGDTLHSASSSQAVTITGVASGFSIAVAPPTLTLVSGQNGTVGITITATNDFSDTIGLGCLSLPSSVNCHFSTNDVKVGSGQSQTVQLTIDTNAPLSGGESASISGSGRGLSLAGIGLPASVLFGFVFWRFRRRHAGFLLGALVMLLAGAFSLSGCSASFSQITAAPGTYTIQISGVGAGSNLSHYQNVTLTVTK